MKTATSSPLYFKTRLGIHTVTCLNLQDKNTKLGLGSTHQGTSSVSMDGAYKDFWDSWKIDHPDYFLVPAKRRIGLINKGTSK